MIGFGQQLDYELDFNSNTNDYVEMTNASTLIANSTTFSMSCWVNPQSNTNHGGIIGFRNNSDADLLSKASRPLPNLFFFFTCIIAQSFTFFS